MTAAPLPPDERERLEALHRTDLLDTPAEERFDRITRIARRLFGVPIASIALIDGDRQWFKSRQGLDVSEVPRAASICAHAILSDGPMVILDAQKDPRFADNPFVTGDRGVRFYAGQALTDADGRRLGTLCIADRTPRAWTPADAMALRDLADMAQAELRHKAVVGERDAYREKALVDALTGLWNRAAIVELLVRELARADRDGTDVAVVMGDLDHFKNVNDTYGHAAGDRVLAETAQRLRTVVRAYDAVGRYGGEEFLIVLPKCDLDAAAKQAERLRMEVAAVPIEFEGQQIAVTISLGVAAGRCAVDELVRAADEALYAAKRAGRNRVEVATSVA